EADRVDLKPLSIHPYTYTHAHQDDDFLPLMRRLVEYDLIIFLTPVYWYSMSGIMKNFFDRITDCLKVEKETGRKLRGMKMAAIACGFDSDETEGFFVPFQNSADYLGMQYLGEVHTWVDEGVVTSEVLERLQQFRSGLENG
ncbi:MAG: flavodoxin family protein, partial [Bacteroidota bacterium]